MKILNKAGFTLLELLIVVVILGILALISVSIILNAGEKAKNSAVMANASAAASTVAFKLTVDPIPNDELVEYVVDELNNPDGIADSGDELRSPFIKTVTAFVSEDSAQPGQVTVIAESDIIVRIKGYGIHGDTKGPLITKVVSTLDLDD